MIDFAEQWKPDLELRQRIDELETELAQHQRFVAVLAHDLLGSLAAPKMASQILMKRSKEPVDVYRLSSKIDAAIARADRMIRDLLDAQLVRSGRLLPISPAELDLAELARETAEDLADVHQTDRFHVDAAEAVRGWWDRNALRRALWNLAGNAVKYGAPDSPIRVRVGRVGNYGLLSVHNQGKPIPASEQARLFQPFTRAASAWTSQIQGWGLGLALVRGAADAHGGRVRVDSSEERGTTFTLELPIEAPAARPAAPPQATEPVQLYFALTH